MSRTRWFVAGPLLFAAVMAGVLNAHGPFDAHPSLGYAPFLADFQAGKVERIVQWRDRLEVTESGVLLAVVVPPERNLDEDLDAARAAGGVGIDRANIPDAWLPMTTPSVPVLLAIAAALIWGTALVRNRRAPTWSHDASGANPAG
ncbi:MAG: hypothetical protein ABIR11_12480 [Candidatus Limnocylindrales bacterium]